jgi:hypothetical protein
MRTYPEINVEKDCIKESTRPSPWDGISREVYRVPLRLLHYNIDNGRIATWVSGYRSDSTLPSLDDLPVDKFNDVIGDFIKRSSSSDVYNRTYRDIGKKGQLVVGAILADGTVVAGNRRFTVLRQLVAEGEDKDKFGYFLCNIYPLPKNAEEKNQIKRLETLTQFNEDSPVPYSPIDKLVDIYHNVKDCTPSGQYSSLEYSKLLNVTPGAMRDLVSRAKILVDYLDYIHKPGNYDIARKDALDGPIAELARLSKKVGTTTWTEIKHTFYHRMWNLENKGGDRTREIRKLIRSYDSDPIGFRGLMDQNDEEELANDASQLGVNPASQSSPVAPSSSSNFDVAVDSYQAKASNASAKREPIDHLHDAYEALMKVDTDAFSYMEGIDQQSFRDALSKVRIMIDNIDAATQKK